MDRMNTLVTYMRPSGKPSPVSKQVMSLDTFPALRAKIHTTSCSEQERSREEGEKGTKGYLWPSRRAVTSLSQKDGSDPPEVDCAPPISIDGDVTWTFKETTSDQSKDQSLNSEGAKTKDTIKILDEPIAQRTRCMLKMQSPSAPRKESIFLDKTDTEMWQLLIQLVAQNKEQQDQIKAMNLVLEEVLAQQTIIVNKLHATEMPWESESKRKVSAQTSNEDTKEVVKPCGPRAETANVCRSVRITTRRTMLPTTNLDSSDVSSLYFDSPQNTRVCMATPKRPQLKDTSISADGNVSSFTSDDSASSPRTEAPTDTSPIPVRSERNPRSVNRAKGKFQVPKEPKDVQDKADKEIKDALGKVPDAIHFNRQGKRTTATLYVGNLEFKASTKELKDVLDRVFKKIHVEDVVIPLKDGRSCGYGFVTLSWAKGSTIDPDNICKVYSGMLNVNSRPIYLRELNSKDNDSVSSSFSWLLERQAAILARLEEPERQEAAPIQ